MKNLELLRLSYEIIQETNKAGKVLTLENTFNALLDRSES